MKWNYKLLNNISLILMSIVILLFLLYNGLQGTNNFLVLIFLFSNPVLNVFRMKKKKINNVIYYILLIIIEIYIIFILANVFAIYFTPDIEGTSFFQNQSSFFISEHMIYILISTILIDLLSLLFKKEIVVEKKDRHKLMLLLISISCLFPFLSRTFFYNISNCLSMAVSIFSFIMIFKHDQLYSASELRKIYLVLGIICLYIGNLFALYFITIIYLQLDDFGLNI